MSAPTFELATPLEKTLTRAGDYALYYLRTAAPEDRADVYALLADIQEATAATVPTDLAVSYRLAAAHSRRLADDRAHGPDGALCRVVTCVLMVAKSHLDASRTGVEIATALSRLADAEETLALTQAPTGAAMTSRAAAQHRKAAAIALDEVQQPPWSA
uniref:hypothetical protein n=1 Tax=Amycolatopsis sp. CA-151526 TaxID=3239921 RepID=UPI003F49B001